MNNHECAKYFIMSAISVGLMNPSMTQAEEPGSKQDEYPAAYRKSPSPQRIHGSEGPGSEKKKSILGPCKSIIKDGQVEDILSPCTDGVALAGGGTKAAAYAMGVLAATVDAGRDDHPFGGIDVVSSVSGGGYAAYYLYSKLAMDRHKNNKIRRSFLRSYYSDCLPDIYKNRLKSLMSDEQYRLLDTLGVGAFCNASIKFPKDSLVDSSNLNDVSDNFDFRFQRYVRCRQDVLEQDCRTFDENDRSNYLNVAVMAAATFVSTVPNLLARTIFDWPVNLSVSRSAYMQGIGSTYGLYPLRWPFIYNKKPLASDKSIRDIVEVCDVVNFRNCWRQRYNSRSAGSAQVAPDTLTFDALQEMIQGRQAPLWIINATSAKDRSLFGWAREGKRDFSRYTMHITPYGMYSGHYGSFDSNFLREQFDPLDAVVTAAAFLDASQTSFGQPARLGTALLLHAAVLDWGRDIPNLNVPEPQRLFHQMLPTVPWPWTGSAVRPIPTYFLDGFLRSLGHVDEVDVDENLAGDRPDNSGFIRLSDGGNNDNMGAAVLFDMGVKRLFISDHSEDQSGKMKDLCLLNNELHLRRGRRLVIPQWKNFHQHCKQFLAESENIPMVTEGMSDSAVDGPPAFARPSRENSDEIQNYDIYGWRRPVLIGCIVKVRGDDGDKNNNISCDHNPETDARQVFIVKPAIDLDRLRTPSAQLQGLQRRVHGGGMAEVIGYVHERGIGRPGSRDKFPQDSTVGMTFASDAARYGAYRELGRFQMAQALRLRDSGKFNEEMKCQAALSGSPKLAELPEACESEWGW